jgi:hypothetical protein
MLWYFVTLVLCHFGTLVLSDSVTFLLFFPTACNHQKKIMSIEIEN